MKHSKNKPCTECPFLKTSTAGWLGPDNAQDVLHTVHGEGGYACHMSVAQASRRLGRRATSSEVQQCAGAILHASLSHKLYRGGAIRKHQDRLRGVSDSQVMDVAEFMHHHQFAKRSDT